MEKITGEHPPADGWSQGLAEHPTSLLESLQIRKQLGPASVLPSASSPYGRERWDLLTDWFPFRDDCLTNPQPTRSRKPSDEGNKLYPGPQRGGGVKWLTSLCILPSHSNSCLPQGLGHSLRAMPRPGCRAQPLLASLAEGDPGRGLQTSPGFFLWPGPCIGWWPWLPWEQDSVFLLSKGSQSRL